MNKSTENHNKQMPEIAGYLLTEQIGSGASGRVYTAINQKSQKQVAIKIPMRFLSEDQLHRFEHESRLLSHLDHKNIAHIFHTGIIEKDNLPFIVMEYIDGINIHQYCQKLGNKNNNQLKEITELFLQVIDAVKYAHNRGIIHRDLKPENIMVDHDGNVKLLDFGIAMAADNATNHLSNLTKLTKTGEIVGTLAYMSPEQVSGNDSIDIRTDVYSLGVVLYQLLSNALPHELSANQIFSAISQIIEDLPAKLSTQNKNIDANLITIVHHAINKNPDDRYQSLREFKKDLQNWLSGKPITVRSNTLWQSLKHIGTKHKALVGGSVLAILGLITGLIFAISFAFKEQQAREIAEFRSITNEKTVDFINKLLTSADPDNIYGEELTVLQVIDHAEATLKSQLTGEVEVEANIRTTLASVYTSLNQIDKAMDQIDSVEKLNLNLTDSPLYIEKNFAIKFIRTKLNLIKGEPGKNIESLKQLVQDLGNYPLMKFKAQVQLSNNYLAMGDVENAEQAITQAINTPASESLPLSHNARIFANSAYAMLLETKGQFEKSKEKYQQALEEHTEILGENHIQTLTVLNNLATVEQKLGNAVEAQELLQRVIKGRTTLLGENHLSTLRAQSNYFSILISTGQLQKAEEFSGPLMAALNEYAGPVSPHTLVVKNMLAYMLEDLDRLEEAEDLYRSTLQAYRDNNITKGPELFGLQNNLAMLLMKQENYTESETIFSELLNHVNEFLGQDHIYYALFSGNYGELLLNMKQYEKAKPFLQQSHDKILASFGESHQRTLKAQKRLEQLSKHE